MKNSVLYALLICLCCAGCGKAVKPPRPPPAVSAAYIDQQDVPVYFDTIGQALSTSVVPVRPQVGGKLIETYVKEGDEVEAGQALYLIDPRPFQAALEQAEANLRKDEALFYYAQKTEERYAKVVEEDYISKLTFEQYQSNTKSAQAQVEADKAAIIQAKLNIEFTRVVAPISGKISAFNVYVGNIVVVDDPNAITTIRPFSPIDISFSLSQQQFEAIRKTQGDAGKWDFIATLPENPEMKLKGQTFFIDNQLNQDTGTLLIKGRVPNNDRELWPGAFLKIKVLYKMVPDGLTVPPGAILIGRDGPYLYVLNEEDKVTPQNVKVITRNEDYIAIESDVLKKGDRVVTDGQINIAPGMRVNVVAPKG